jgi:uncharacterized RDD family membrane protein YckC
LMIAGLVFSIATQQRHALQGQHALQAFLFVVLGLYFVWFWSHGGQTVAMRTWHIRLTALSGDPVSRMRALARYLLSWIWFLPALATVYFSGLTGGWPSAAAVLAGVLGYALVSRLQPQRQFWHDALCGTQLVDTKPAPALVR